MGLFGIFAGKKPEDHEQRGDQHFRDKAFGDARIEFEKALYKIETRFPEKKHLAERIRQKLDSASESLAMAHIQNAEALAGAGDTEEAAEFCELALALTQQENTRQRIARTMELIAVRSHKNTGWNETEDNPEFQELTSSGHPGAGSDPEIGESDDEEMFTVLCNALPADTAEAYRGYGQSFAKGYIALNRGDFDLAVKELSAAMEENRGKNTMIPLELATAYLHAEDHDRARDLLGSFLRENPAEIRAYQLLCEIYWEAGQHFKAASLLESAPAEIGQTFPMRLLEGETRFQAGDTDGARAVFNKLIDENGANEIVLRSLAKICEAAGDVEEARELYAQIMNHCASCRQVVDPFVKRRYAELSLETGDTSPKILDLFFSLVQEDPDHRADYYLRIGKIYEKRGEMREARRYLDLAGQAV